MAGLLADDLNSGSGTPQTFKWPCTINEVANPGDVLQDTTIFLTDAHLAWERLYLVRLAKGIHRMVASNLNRDEETLFMLFIAYDTNLDGVVSGNEARKLLSDGKRYFTKVTFTHGNEQVPLLLDGMIKFISLLRWYAENGTDAATGSLSLLSLVVGFAGSGFLHSDRRIDELDYLMLQRNIVGYRRVLRQVRAFKAEQKLEAMQIAEVDLGSMQVGALYHDMLVHELEGDEEHLFNLFLEVDASGDLLLQHNEIQNLMRLLDPSATESDLAKYVKEMNINDRPLTFVTFIDWWQQAKQAPASLVMQKGTGLLASFKARASAQWVGSFFSEDTPATRVWYLAAGRGADGLSALRNAYIKCFHDVREHRVEHALRNLEHECAKPS